MEEQNKTPISQMQPADLTAKLDAFVRQAYFRRSRNLPANLTEMVSCLKGDLLKAYPDCPINVVDEAITTSTLHDTDVTTISVAFFFNAVKKAWFTPKTNKHQWDGTDEDLAYWESRVKWLEGAHLTQTNQYRHACEMVEHYRHGDTEQDTVSLLDTCASMLAKMDAAEAKGQAVAKKGEFKGVVVDLPAFNSRREYGYLVMRKQLAPDAASHFFSKAIQAVNDDRLATHHHRLEKSAAATDPDVLAKCQRLAVLDWLRSCNTRNTTPSAILTPLAEELSYFQFRRTR